MKVSLLGDSIRRIGYGLKVPELLADELEVFQPDDNCRFAKYTLRGLHDWREDMAGSDIVHWNNGIWDVAEYFDDGPFTCEQEYVETMTRIARILLSRHKRVIFATTTPLHYNNKNNGGDRDGRANTYIKRYNDLLVPILKDMGVIINDLYTTVYENMDEYMHEDKIHLSERGIEVCARQVADCIRAVAATLR